MRVIRVEEEDERELASHPIIGNQFTQVFRSQRKSAKTVIMPSTGVSSPFVRRMTETLKESRGLEDARTTRMYFQRLTYLEAATAIFIGLSFAVSALEYEIAFANQYGHVQKGILYILSILTLLIIFTLILRYRTMILFLRSRNEITPAEGYFPYQKGRQLAIEILLVIPHPNALLQGIRVYTAFLSDAPGLYYEVNELLNILQLVRLFILLRVLFMYSIYFGPSCRRIGGMYDVGIHYLFCIKATIMMNPIKLISLSVGISLFIFCYAIHISEQATSRIGQVRGFESYANVLWNVIETMTTVGYGEYTASTFIGRVVTFFTGLWGVLTVSMITAALTNFLSMGILELRAYMIIQKLRLRKEMEKKAAITASLTAKMARKASQGEKLSYLDIVELRNSTKEFRAIKRLYRAPDLEGFTLNEEMMREFSFFRSELSDLQWRQKKLNDSIQQLVDEAEELEEQSLAQKEQQENAKPNINNNRVLEYKFWKDWHPNLPPVLESSHSSLELSLIHI
eukprot:TRINITY_DN3643_c0_g1_i12.p1 TRINITY_DN3643_c0_g1~~TRINITY_DN3643_c0_g1_i12.p1  ORF type:complete len:512 (-),score=86.66 TRINITY_DN3643_c0_g1_i12:60-1595(-)